MTRVTRYAHGSRVPGWDQAADLDKEPAGVPEPALVEVPAALRREIEAAMALYPDRHSAALPALAAAQRLHGWCSPEAIEQVACVMRVTPAYLSSVATFYDMLELAPVGRHSVYVCTNISCSLRGGERRQRGRARVRVEGHVGLDLAAQLVSDRGGRGIRDRCRGLLDIRRRVPTARAHRSIPPRIGSSIAVVAIMSAM